MVLRFQIEWLKERDFGFLLLVVYFTLIRFAFPFVDWTLLSPIASTWIPLPIAFSYIKCEKQKTLLIKSSLGEDIYDKTIITHGFQMKGFESISFKMLLVCCRTYTPFFSHSGTDFFGLACLSLCVVINPCSYGKC